MEKIINALGLMSGTSMDGIDASIIRSDGEKNIDIIGDLYIKYDSELKNSLNKFYTKINTMDDLKKNLDEFKFLERQVTIKHSEISFEISNKFGVKPDIVGFHGQTIIHKPEDKYSIQMGNGNLLSNLLQTNIVCEFRKEDIEKGGEGAPLTPIYHHNIKKKFNLDGSVIFLNIGGIANITISRDNIFFAKDVGPGNCLMDMYIKKFKKIDFDDNGKIAASGKVDYTLVNNILDHINYNSKKKHSLDIRDFDINFVKGLSVENALANLNFFTAKMISENIKEEINENLPIILCGGGRKNSTLVSNLKKFLNNTFYNIDNFNINGDFIESQAFAYLAVRSLYKKHISFPNTTKVTEAISGGKIIKFI